jgi:hypothetical protein
MKLVINLIALAVAGLGLYLIFSDFTMNIIMAFEAPDITVKEASYMSLLLRAAIGLALYLAVTRILFIKYELGLMEEEPIENDDTKPLG